MRTQLQCLEIRNAQPTYLMYLTGITMNEYGKQQGFYVEPSAMVPILKLSIFRHGDATCAPIKPCSHIQYSQNHMKRVTNDFYTTTIFFSCAATMQCTTSKHPDAKPQMSVLINVIQCLNVHMLYLV